MNQQVQRVKNRPMKSPSPDFASRNKITDTKPPIDDVRRYIEKTSSSRSPKRSHMTIAVAEANDASLFAQRIRELEAMNEELKEENARLRQLLSASGKKTPINRLDEMSETVKSHTSSALHSPQNAATNANQQKEIQDRLLRLANENSRIAALLNEKDRTIALLKEENGEMKKQFTFLRASQSGIKPEQFNAAKDYYESRIEPEMRESEISWQKKLRAMNQKLTQLQITQKQIEQMMLARSSMVTPFKSKFSSSQARQTQDPYQSRNQNFPRTAPFDAYSSEKQDLIMRCDNLEERNRFLQEELRKEQASGENRNLIHSSSSRSSKMKASSENFLKNKVKELENELQQRIIQNSILERDLKNLKEDSGRKREKLQRDMSLLESERNTLKRALQKQKQQTAQLQDENEKIKEHLKQLEDQINSQDLEPYKEQLKQHFAIKEQSIKDEYEVLLKTKDDILTEQLRNYLSQLKHIRQNVEGSELENFIAETEEVINENTTIERKISMLQDQNYRIITDLKMQLARKSQEVLELQKENNLLRAEVSELNHQKEKLKELMLQIQSIKPVTSVVVREEETERTEKKTKKYRSERNCKLRTCLKDTIQKIDNLESQITDILREEQTTG